MNPGAPRATWGRRAAALAAALSLFGASGRLVGEEPPGGDAPPGDERAGALRVAIETIAVDRRGTWSVGRDEADIFPGSSGSLSKSATLFGREDGSAREMVQLEARIVPARRADGSCALRLDLETRSVVAGAAAAGPRNAPRVDRKTAEVVVRPDEERLVEAYDSSVTQGRLAFKVRCGAAQPAAVEASPRFVDFVLSIARAEGKKELRPLKSDGLRATLGRGASNLFSFNVSLEPRRGGGKRYRKEEIEVILTPVLISAGRLQVEMRVRGELATVSATEATIPHPIDREQSLVVAPGEPHSQEIEVASSDPQEGWSRVRYRLEVVSRF
jgi:hypothetical protein